MAITYTVCQKEISMEETKNKKKPAIANLGVGFFGKMHRDKQEMKTKHSRAVTARKKSAKQRSLNNGKS